MYCDYEKEVHLFWVDTYAILAIDYLPFDATYSKAVAFFLVHSIMLLHDFSCLACIRRKVWFY